MILGYLFIIIMGITLGLMGAGGSILTIPILVYLLNIKPMLATTYSLAVIGSSALLASIRYAKNRLLDIKVIIIFSVPALLMMFIARHLILPRIQNPLWGIEKDIWLMLLFSVLMICAAVIMLKPPITLQTLQTSKTSKNKNHSFTDNHNHQQKLYLIKQVSVSAVIGFFTGILGAGGGFLMIPALISLFKLPIKKAVACSLTIIAFNSLLSFQADLITGVQIDWSLMIKLLACTLFGVWLGTLISDFFQGDSLKKIFAIFTFLMGCILLIKQVIIISQVI